MPANWPEVTLALTLAIVVAYLVADFVARTVQTVLRAIIADPQYETFFVDRPRRVIRLAIFLVTLTALALPALTLAGYQTTIAGDRDAVVRWLLDHGLRIVIIVVAGYLVIRIGSASSRRFEREMSHGSGLDVVERTKRAQTLGRLMQKTLSIVVTGIAVLMVLRELDIDITPVLTGAGIVGLAVGFGAQTLVRDIISGFFLILEDQVRVGDVAIVNGQGGLVEEVNLRTIVLRDETGTVHVFPNGEVKTLANSSKDFSFYVITTKVPFDEEPERVAAAMREAAATLMDDPEFKPHILEPLDVYGVDAWEPGALTIKARIKTVPLKQWFVGRELRKRIVKVFVDRRITVPIPEMQLRVDGRVLGGHEVGGAGGAGEDGAAGRAGGAGRLAGED
jgi:moderate conductance mechanosensitive channel